MKSVNLENEMHASSYSFSIKDNHDKDNKIWNKFVIMKNLRLGAKKKPNVCIYLQLKYK